MSADQKARLYRLDATRLELAAAHLRLLADLTQAGAALDRVLDNISIAKAADHIARTDITTFDEDAQRWLEGNA